MRMPAFMIRTLTKSCAYGLVGPRELLTLSLATTVCVGTTPPPLKLLLTLVCATISYYAIEQTLSAA